MTIKPHVLIIEDSDFFAVVFRDQIKELLGFDVTRAVSHRETLEATGPGSPAYLAALVDLQLPDAGGDTVVMLVEKRGIRGIVFTSRCEELCILASATAMRSWSRWKKWSIMRTPGSTRPRRREGTGCSYG